MTFVCPVCESESHNPKDLEYGFCGRCDRFTGDELQRTRYLRDVILGEAPLRAPAQLVIETQLVELAGVTDDQALPEWTDEHGEPLLSALTVGLFRRTLRVLLSDLATRTPPLMRGH